jgi:magnesium-transporting ATPase (P-type)
MKDNKFSKIITYIVTAIAVVGIILLVRVLMAGEDAVENDVLVQNSVVSPLVSFSLYLLIGVVIVTLVLSLLGLFKNPENLKKTLLGLTALGVLFVVAYFMADSNVVIDNANDILEGGEEGSSINQFTGAGIWFSIILGGIGLAFFVYDLVKGLIKA